MSFYGFDNSFLSALNNIPLSVNWKWKFLSHVQLFATPWTVACQEFYPWNSPGQNTGVGSLSLLHWVFPTQELNRGLLYCRWILYQLNYQVVHCLDGPQFIDPFAYQNTSWLAIMNCYQFSSVQSLSCLWLFATPWTTAHQASLSITNSRSPPKPMSIESVMPSNHLILCRPLLLLPSIFPNIGVFSNESALHIRWPK